mmetsp:Transcript_66374/g.135156  ORF Transcript_66374/g.135156 Transcript_66374/m.135156 type:complete len:153 (-) Transcript_66374:102-560(-)
MASMHISLIVLSSLIALGASNSQASLSLLQTSITLQRGSVNEIAAATPAMAELVAAGDKLRAEELAKKLSSAAAHAKTEDKTEGSDEVDLESEEDDELAAHASKVSLMQTSFTIQRAPGRFDELASLRDDGIEDDDEALGLLDAAMEMGLSH